MTGKGEKRKQDASSDKAAKKAKFFSTNKGVTLPLGQRGILVSCLPNKSKLAGQEAIRLLQPYYEEMLPAMKKLPGGGKNLDKLLDEEVAELKDPNRQVFKQHETGISSLVFISMLKGAPGPGPAMLVQAVAEEINRTRQCKTRLCMRFSPVEIVCPMDLDSIKKAAAEHVWPYFKNEEDKGFVATKFAVAYEHRASAGLDRLTVIKTVADGIKQPPHKADLKSPDLTVLVQVVKDACAMGVACKYRELAKFNMRELASPDPKNIPHPSQIPDPKTKQDQFIHATTMTAQPPEKSNPEPTIPVVTLKNPDRKPSGPPTLLGR